MNRRLSVLFTANKALPDNDHRLIYGEISKVCSMTYALPGKPGALDPAAYIRVNMGEGLRLRYLFHLMLLMFTLLRKRRLFDVCSHNSTLPILIGPLLSILVGVPSVITVTGFGRLFTSDGLRHRILRPLYMRLLGLSIRLSRRVLFQNHGDLADLADRFPLHAHKFHYAGSAVSMPVFEEKDFSAPTLKVFLASRLMPDKGVDDFLQTAEKLQGQGFEFVLAGPGSIGFDDIFEKVKRYHAPGIIRYLGELNSAEMLSEFGQAHIFFLPSYGEGMARVMLEAGFAQTCPIGYDISANRDLIAEGRGFLAPRGDIDAAVSILRTLAGDRKALRANAINYQKHILQNYSMEVFCHRLDEIFKELALELGIEVMGAPRPSLSPYTTD